MIKDLFPNNHAVLVSSKYWGGLTKNAISEGTYLVWWGIDYGRQPSGVISKVRPKG